MDKQPKVHVCANEGCRTRLSSIDPHLKCPECRGTLCSYEASCDECSALTKDQYAELEKRRKKSADKSKHKKEEKDTVVCNSLPLLFVRVLALL